MSKRTVIDVSSLHCSRGKKNVISDLSFTIKEGEFLSVIGPNGAGKTSLLLCFLLQLKYKGNISLNNQSLETYNAKELAQTISYVPQADGRSIPYTVREFVLMGRYPHTETFSSYSKSDYRKVEEALLSTSCCSLSKRSMDTLSGGERQKVFLTAALAQGSKILLLDEPTTFLDPKHEQEIFNILCSLHRDEQSTIISVTHDLNRAALASDRILALRDGKMAFHGTPQDLMRNTVLEKIFSTSFLFVDHPTSGIPMTLARSTS